MGGTVSPQKEYFCVVTTDNLDYDFFGNIFADVINQGEVILG